MTMTNHYLVGVGVALVLKNPLLVVPVAFASHFVLDSLPHYDYRSSLGVKIKNQTLVKVTIVDALILLIAMALTLSQYPFSYVVAGLVACLPDTVWAYRFVVKEKFGKIPPGPTNKFTTWHAKIQKYERPWGSFVEAGFAALMFLLIF